MKWLEDLSRSLAYEPDIVPKGWVTPEQAAKIRGTCVQTQRRLFTSGIKAGLVATKKFKVKTKTGKLLSMSFYGPKP